MRWLGQLSNTEARIYLDTLDRCDPATQRRELVQNRGTVVVDKPLPRLHDLILHAKRTRLDCHGKNTRPVVFRAIMAEAAGRYAWDDIRQAFRDFLADREIVKARIRKLQEEDSVRAETERIERANLAAEGIVIVRLPTDPRIIDGAPRFPLEAEASPTVGGEEATPAAQSEASVVQPPDVPSTVAPQTKLRTRPRR